MVEILLHLEDALMVARGRKKSAQVLGRALVPHILVIGSERNQHLLISAEEGRGVSGGFIPYEAEPGVEFENAREFLTGWFGIDPLSRLRRSNDVHAVIGQRRSFRAPCAPRE